MVIPESNDIIFARINSKYYHKIQGFSHIILKKEVIFKIFYALHTIDHYTAIS